MRVTFAVVLSSLLLPLACRNPPDAPSAQQEDYVLVFLRSGPTTDLSRERARQVMAGHFANMARLAEQGDLLVAGPLGPPRAEPDLRGIYVFDRAEVDAGLALASTDPGGQAGVFVFEGHAWRAPAALRRLPALDAELRAPLPEDAGPGATARRYVMVRCRDAARARTALAPLMAAGSVLLFGELTAEEPPGAVLVLDAEDLDGARALLAAANDVPEDFWQLHPWFASRALEKL